MSAVPDVPLIPADNDTQETREWLDALAGVIEHAGPHRAHFLLEQLIAEGHRAGINIPYSATTDYINTIPVNQQPLMPGDSELEHTIRAYARWNAMVMVLRANRDGSGSPGISGCWSTGMVLM